MGVSLSKKNPFPLGLKFRQYESDLARKRQNLVDPDEKGYNYERHIVGISEHPDEISFQVIFSDNTRTKADDSCLDKTKWRDLRIPKNSVINRAEVMFDKNDCLLLGFKFYDKPGNTLLATSWMTDPRYAKRENFSHLGFKEIPLGETERLLGMRSDTRGKKIACHYDFQFVIARKPTEEEARPPETKKTSCLQNLKKKMAS